MGNEMSINDALDIIAATKLLAKTFGEDHQAFLSSLCIFWEDRRTILNEAIIKTNNFKKADIVERGKMLGITVHPYEPNDQEATCGNS